MEGRDRDIRTEKEEERGEKRTQGLKLDIMEFEGMIIPNLPWTGIIPKRMYLK